VRTTPHPNSEVTQRPQVWTRYLALGRTPSSAGEEQRDPNGRSSSLKLAAAGCAHGIDSAQPPAPGLAT
jgi:hypothetical protein